jgi:O-antigen/teichoic acid export membrane protein
VSLVRDVVTGVKWSAVGRSGEHLVGFITTAVLVHLLSPQAFGVVAIAALVTGFLVVIADLGTATALIQRPDVSDTLESTVFWASLVIGLVLTGLAWALAPAVGLFFHDPAVVPVVRALSLTVTFGAVGAVPTALLTRRLSFDSIARVQLAASGLGGAAGVALAFSGAGAWSLVGQVLTRTALEAAGMLAFSKFRPWAGFRRKDLVSVASFGVNLSGFHVTNFVTRNIDNLLIGRFLGATMLGYYDVAWRLIEYPKAALAGIVGRVTVPAYARMQADDERFGRAYLRVVAAIALVTVPAMIGLMVVAWPFVRVVFGNAWLSTALLVTVLAPVGLAQSMGSTTGGVYIAKDRTGWLFAWSVLASGCTAAAVAVGLRWGVVGVAAGRLLAAGVLFPLNLAISLGFVGLGLRHLGRTVGPVLAAGLVMAVGVMLLRLAMLAVGVVSPLATLLTAIPAGAIIYGIALWRLRPPILVEILSTLVTADVAWARPLLARAERAW